MKKFWLALIKLYQKSISPDKGLPARLGLGAVCRFHPTCSEYAYQSIEKYGSTAGWKLSFKRIARCHPLTAGGYDPVP